MLSRPRILVGATVVLTACADAPQSPDPSPSASRLAESADAVGLSLGPIEGYTTTWHDAPEAIAIPVDGRLHLRHPTAADEVVVWRGASEVERTSEVSIAQWQSDRVETHTIEAEVWRDGRRRSSDTIEVQTVDVAPGAMRVDAVDVRVEPHGLSPASTNPETVGAFFSTESIAELRLEGRRFETSVDRTLQFEARASIGSLASIVEWRRNGEPVAIGPTYSFRRRVPGPFEVSAGPPPGRTVELFAYSVDEVTLGDGRDMVEDLVPVTFHANTTPPGFEDRVSWMSSTLFGSAAPVLGKGASFEAMFSGTWGELEDAPRQWLGVRADNRTFHQDVKEFGSLLPASEAVYTEEIPPDFYDRMFVPMGPSVSIFGASSVRVQPPNHPLGYSYGPDGQYGVYVDADNDRHTLWFGAEGVYHSISIFDALQVIVTIAVGAPFEQKLAPGKTGCTEMFTVSDADLVVSDRVGSDYARWDYYEDDLGQEMIEVESVADGVAKIAQHVAENGKMDKLTIANHATNGFISMGAGSGNDPAGEFGKFPSGNPRGAYQTLVDGLKGKFNANASICIVGCNVGEGEEGRQLVNCLADDLGNGITVMAKKGAVSYPLLWNLTSRYPMASGEKGWVVSE